MPSKEELLKAMHDGVVEFETEKAVDAAKQWIADGHSALEGIMDGLVAGMNTVGQLFKDQEYFVPEFLLCAESMNSGLDILKPHLTSTGDKAGKVVIGTIQGDIHDLGKNLVSMMLEVGGFEVIDLGNNVEFQTYVDAAIEHKADIVAISAMMTTTMMGIKKLLPMLRASCPDAKVLIGGAPVTGAVVKMFGAEGYAASAVDVSAEARRVLGR